MSALVTSETGTLPILGKTWISKLRYQFLGTAALRHPARFCSTTRLAASAKVGMPAERRFSANRKLARGRACGWRAPAPAPRRARPVGRCRARTRACGPGSRAAESNSASLSSGRRGRARCRRSVCRVGPSARRRPRAACGDGVPWACPCGAWRAIGLRQEIVQVQLGLHDLPFLPLGHIWFRRTELAGSPHSNGGDPGRIPSHVTSPSLTPHRWMLSISRDWAAWRGEPADLGHTGTIATPAVHR